MERSMKNPRAIVHAETQYEVALMAGEMGLLEELPYEFLSPSDHHSDDHFATFLSPSYALTKELPLSTFLRRIASHHLRPERDHQFLKQNFR